jgi:hypothetical protein
MLKTVRTGLVAQDVFYFGNLVGETGNSTTVARVDAADFIATRVRLLAAADLTDRYDFNRDGRINTSDLAIARGATSATIPLLAAPGAAAAAPASFGDTRIVSSTSTAATAPPITPTGSARRPPRRTWYEQPADLLA